MRSGFYAAKMMCSTGQVQPLLPKSSNVVPLWSCCRHCDADLVDANGASVGRTLVNAFELSRDLDAIHRGKAYKVLCNAMWSLGPRSRSDTGSSRMASESPLRTGFTMNGWRLRPMRRFASATVRATGFCCMARKEMPAVCIAQDVSTTGTQVFSTLVP